MGHHVWKIIHSRTVFTRVTDGTKLLYYSLYVIAGSAATAGLAVGAHHILSQGDAIEGREIGKKIADTPGDSQGLKSFFQDGLLPWFSICPLRSFCSFAFTFIGHHSGKLRSKSCTTGVCNTSKLSELISCNYILPFSLFTCRFPQFRPVHQVSSRIGYLVAVFHVVPAGLPRPRLHLQGIQSDRRSSHFLCRNVPHKGRLPLQKVSFGVNLFPLLPGQVQSVLWQISGTFATTPVALVAARVTSSST